MFTATEQDQNLIIEILCKSFDSNPSVNFVAKQGNNRRRHIRNLVKYSLKQCLKYGKVFISDDKKACALILLPDKKKGSINDALDDIKLIFNCIGLKGISKVMNRDKKIKAEYPHNKIYCLWYIGVEPEFQGKGIGTKFLKEIIADAKLMNRAIYLETSVPANLRLYERNGFVQYKELDFGTKLFLMKNHLN